jgi:hypothetical protein
MEDEFSRNDLQRGSESLGNVGPGRVDWVPPLLILKQ